MGENLGTFLGRSAFALWLGVVFSSGVAVSAPAACETELVEAGVQSASFEVKREQKSSDFPSPEPDIKALLSLIAEHTALRKSKNPSAPAPKLQSPEDHWRAVGLRFTALHTFVNNQKCYDTPIHFLMCVAAVRTLVKFSPDNHTLLPKERREVAALFGATVESHGAIEIVQTRPLEILDAASAPGFTRKIETAIRNLWLRMFDSGERIDFERLLETFRVRYVSLNRESYITASAINEALVQADAHARIEATTHLEQSQRSSNEDLVGVGLVFGVHRGKFIVQEVIPGSPAEQAGIKVRDQILAVQGKSVEKVGFTNVARAIRGAAGTEVEIQAKRGADQLSFKVMRRGIRIDNVQARMLRIREASIGYVRLGSFMDPSSPEQIGTELRSLEAQGARAFILDLRQNPGGLLSSAVEIAGLFLGAGKHAVTQKSLVAERKDVKHITSMEKATDLPLILLVDASSASASELLSALLQDEGRAVVIGERSFGKGTVQSHIDFSALHSDFEGLPVVLWRTVARFVLPSGRTTQIDGVTPHIAVARTPEGDPQKSSSMREEDLFPNALPATEVVKLPSFPYRDEWLRQCIEKTGQARSLYEENAATELPYDFQLLTALDAAKCMDQYEAWKEAYRGR